VRSVWICNLVPAPAELDPRRMKAGLPPLNPRAHCAHPRGTAPPDADDLRVVWLPEGSGAALYERDAVRAIIPPWSGIDGFPGYSRDGVGEGPLAWALRDDNALVARFRDAERFWETWSDDDTWPALETALCRRVEEALGPRSSYYGISGDRWPPRALVRIPRTDGIALVTIGMCALPQPGVELAVEDPAPLRRVELAALLPASWGEAAIKRFASYLSGQSQLPWARHTWLGPGHTIPCDAWQRPELTVAALTDDQPGIGRLELGEQFGDPVSVLWLVPRS
jgi:hypothetical protein